jgi:sulfite reductase (ferredoxin)
MTSAPKLSGVEHLKRASDGLRGSLAAELAADGISVSEDAYNLLKFHGSYEQFDRDTATERKQAKLEKEYQFMARVRIPGGAVTATQYLALDQIAGEFANDTLRITSRQGIQYHGVLKHDLKPAIARVNDALMTTLCACGDVVRNLMTSPAPLRDAKHARLRADATMLSAALLPKSRAYYQIFLDEKPIAGLDEEETLYGPVYLPRKFKIGIALPEDNTIDVLTQDLAVIARWDGETLLGYDIAVGGGLGMTHNRVDTYPRLATPLCFVPPDRLLAIVEAVIKVQRDHGGRADRRRARLKYLVDDRGLDFIRSETEAHYGAPLTDPHPLPVLSVPDFLGWHEQGDGLWWLGVPVPSGRIADAGDQRIRSGLRAVVSRFGIDAVFTPQQDILLTDIASSDRDEIERMLRAHGVRLAGDLSKLERFTLACPALPTCGLALTEAERVRAPFVEALDAALERHGLADRDISFRITGCPNGCVRTYTGDIGLVGRVPGSYAVYVGGDFAGTRLSFRLLERVPQADVVASLDTLFAGWASDGRDGEGFGDWCTRQGQDALLQRLSVSDA